MPRRRHALLVRFVLHAARLSVALAAPLTLQGPRYSPRLDPRPGPRTGVVVLDRYQNDDAFTAVRHQLCCAHVLRDLEDAAESYPGAIWPGQAPDAMRTLTHVVNVALQKVPRVPGKKNKESPGHCWSA